MKLRTIWSDLGAVLLLVPAMLLTACRAATPPAARPSPVSVKCGGGEQVFADPVVAVAQDSVTAGGPAAVAQFHWTALALPVSHGTWGTDDRTIIGTVDSLGRARVSVPMAGRYAFRARVLGSVLRLDTLTIPRDSTIWVRIGLARATIHYACATVSSTDPPP